MANRSYIYGLKNSKYVSIGEHPYYIPYAFKILASCNTTVEDSALFDRKVGIKADFLKGKEALYFLLDFFSSTKKMEKAEEFDAFVMQTKTFLDNIDAEFIILENGEIYSLYEDEDNNYLSAEGLERANETECKTCKNFYEDIDILKKYRIQPTEIFNLNNESLEYLLKWIIELRTKWETELGLNSWSNVLYFQF